MHELSFNVDKSNLEELFTAMFSVFDEEIVAEQIQQLVGFVDGIAENDKDAVSLSVVYGGQAQELYFAVRNKGGSIELMFLSEVEGIVANLRGMHQQFCRDKGI
jgi:hypothetical protein